MTTMDMDMRGVTMDAFCAACGNRYGNHHGMSCPEGGTTFALSSDDIDEDDDDETETETETQTVDEFFYNMRRFTYVNFGRRNHVGHRYVFMGHYYDDDDNYVPRVVDSQNGGVVEFGQDDLNRPNDSSNGNYFWSTHLENGAVKYVDREHQTLFANLVDYRMAYERMNRERGEGEQAKADFRTLNAKINEYANESGMCPDYERRLDRWNADMQHMKLVGRPRDWSVCVKIESLGMEGYITVNATGPTNANEVVEKMSGTQILGKLLEAGVSMGDSDKLIAEITRRAE